MVNMFLHWQENYALNFIYNSYVSQKNVNDKTHLVSSKLSCYLDIANDDIHDNEDVYV